MDLSAVPTKTQLSNFLGTPVEDYFKGNPKSLNFYFLVIWWGKSGFGCRKLSSLFFLGERCRLGLLVSTKRSVHPHVFGKDKLL